MSPDIKQWLCQECNRWQVVKDSGSAPQFNGPPASKPKEIRSQCWSHTRMDYRMSPASRSWQQGLQYAMEESIHDVKFYQQGKMRIEMPSHSSLFVWRPQMASLSLNMAPLLLGMCPVFPFCTELHQIALYSADYILACVALTLRCRSLWIKVFITDYRPWCWRSLSLL